MNAAGARRLALVGVALLAGGLAACREAERTEELVVEVHFDPKPPQVGPCSLHLELFDQEQRPLHGARVRVEGNMNHAGMVPEVGSAAEVSPGLYAADLEFTMGGDWFLVVSAMTEGGDWMETTVLVPGVKPQSAESRGSE